MVSGRWGQWRRAIVAIGFSALLTGCSAPCPAQNGLTNGCVRCNAGYQWTEC